MDNKKSGSERYAYIDVLRGLAALLVVYQHTSEVSLPAAGAGVHPWERFTIELLSRQIGVGEVGVCIFLMISGFVVPFSLFRYRVDPIRNFVAHRFFRLYPAYWLSVPLGLVFVSWRFGPAYGGEAIDWARVWMNATMFQAIFGYKDLMGQYWTLALELLFYGLCMLLFVAGRLTSVKAIVGVLIGVFLLKEGARHVVNLSAHYAWVFSYFRYVGFMFFGLMYRKWLLEGDSRAGRHALLLLALTLLMLGIVSDIRHAIAGDPGALKPVYAQLIAVAVFVVFTRIYRPRNAVGRYLGEISYSVYLFHPVLFYPLFLYWFQDSPLRTMPHIFVVLSMLATVGFASLTYRFVEKPFVELGKRRFSGKAVPVPATA